MTPARYFIKCDDCKATMGDTTDMAQSAAGGRCAPCRGYTAGRRVWIETEKKAVWPDGKRPGVIVSARQGNECVNFRSDTTKTGFSESIHWKHLHLEEERP